MSEEFLQLPASDRREALAVAAAASGRPLHLLDKDVWLVWLLEVLFRVPLGEHSSSRAAPRCPVGIRSSVDSPRTWLTNDIRVLARELADPGLDPVPPTRSQEKRWTKEIRTRLPVWINELVLPRISKAIADQGFSAALSTEGEQVFFQYAPLTTGSGYVRPVVMLEFGARSTGEPWEPRLITCDAAASVAGVASFTYSASKVNFEGANASRGTGTI